MENVNCLRCRFRHEDNGNCTAVGGFCTAVPAAHCPQLREYLDTRLTPEEVSELVKDWSDLCTIVGECGGLTRVKALAEADKDGRLVVRPYSIGETVYVLLKDGAIFYPETNGWYISEEIIEAISHDGFYLGDPVDDVYTPDSAIGKTVFLTKKAAKAALEAMKDG